MGRVDCQWSDDWKHQFSKLFVEKLAILVVECRIVTEDNALAGERWRYFGKKSL